MDISPAPDAALKSFSLYGALNCRRWRLLVMPQKKRWFLCSITTSGAVGFVPAPDPAPPVNAVYVLPSNIAASLTPSAIAIFSVPAQL